MNKIRKGDEVVVRVGKDKGKKGLVLSVRGQHVVVDGINRVKKHARPNPAQGVQGGVVEKNMPIHLSNIALVDKNGKPSRVAIQISGGRKVRVLTSTGAALGV